MELQLLSYCWGGSVISPDLEKTMSTNHRLASAYFLLRLGITHLTTAPDEGSHTTICQTKLSHLNAPNTCENFNGSDSVSFVVFYLWE